jgi:hypothetical protein
VRFNAPNVPEMLSLVCRKTHNSVSWRNGSGRVAGSNGEDALCVEYRAGRVHKGRCPCTCVLPLVGPAKGDGCTETRPDTGGGSRRGRESCEVTDATAVMQWLVEGGGGEEEVVV